MAMIIIPLAGCTNGDDTKTTTTNPIVALQEDVDELNDNFNTEVANIKSRLSTLETSSIPANITNRVTTLEANVAALQVTVNALSAGDSVDLTALTEAVNDIADDVLAARSNIDVISGNIDAINLDIADLKNKYNSITIPDYDSRIQEVELRIVSILSSVQTHGTDITAIKADIVNMIDMIDDIALNTDNNISALNNELNNVKSRLIAVENTAAKASITRFVSGTSYLEFTTARAGDYVIVLTFYGNNLDTIAFSLPSSQNTEIVFDEFYGIDNTMRTVILQLKDAGTPAVQQNWQANKTYEINYTNADNIEYATLTIGER
jgi:polyhydroxyalkanoate synthesis regulator phasin